MMSGWIGLLGPLSCFLFALLCCHAQQTDISFHGCNELSPKNSKYFKQFPVTVTTSSGPSTIWLPYKYYNVGSKFRESFPNFGTPSKYLIDFDNAKGITFAQVLFTDDGVTHTFGTLRYYGTCGAGLHGDYCPVGFYADTFYITGGSSDSSCETPANFQRGLQLQLCWGSGGDDQDWTDCDFPSNMLQIGIEDTNAIFKGQTNYDFCDADSWCFECNANSVPDPTDETNCVCNSGYYTKSGELSKSANLLCRACKPGSYFMRETNEDDGSLTSAMDDCPQCPENTYGRANSKGQTECTVCPNHSSSDLGSFTCLCDPGYYAKGTPYPFGTTTYFSTTECLQCEAGYYCPGNKTFTNSYNSKEVTCPSGYYCPVGTVDPTVCPAGSYCPQGAANSVFCVEGTYSHAGWSSCEKCLPGTYCPQNSATPQSCTAGNYCSDGKKQTACKSGEYCVAGRSQPSYCGGGTQVNPNFLSVTPYDSEESCQCKNAFAGEYCTLNRCDSKMPGQFSLGSLLLNSDVTLQQYTATYGSSSKDTINSALVYLKSLIVSIDLNGDTYITETEMRYMLTVKSITYYDALRYIWCPIATSALGCRSYVPVDKMYADAVSNFHRAPMHTFDGSQILTASGEPVIYNLQATYPNPKFANEECSLHNILDGKVPPQVTWSFRSGFNGDVCGYSNGYVDPSFNAASHVTTQLRSGSLTSYVDRIKSPTAKRVQCIVVNDQFLCTVGLSYDGRPYDLSASLIDGGVAFTYLDTSIKETQFDIFIGAQGSEQSSKSFVVGINYPSFSCGRLSEHISFLDTKRKNAVGQLFEYGVVAIESDSYISPSTQTAMTIFPYRIPFYIRITGLVVDRDGVGVPHVGVNFCHIDSNTGKPDTDPDYCPVATFYTDKRGEISGELRVSDINWANLIESFDVTASFTEVFVDGTTVVHYFNPPTQRVRLDHTIGRGSVKFVDLTSISVFGKVLFDPQNTGGSICPFAGVPVTLTEVSTGSSETTISAPDGSFSFALTKGAEAYVSINPYQGHTWRMVNDTTDFKISRRRLFAPYISSNDAGASLRRKSDAHLSSSTRTQSGSISTMSSESTVNTTILVDGSLPICLYGSCIGGGTCVAGATCVVAPDGYSAMCKEVNIPTANCILTHQFGCASTAVNKNCCNPAAFCNRNGNCDINTPGCRNVPVFIPSSQPSRSPTQQPNRRPSKQPSKQPLHYPTRQPSKQPSKQPRNRPSSQPSVQPNQSPSLQPSIQPSCQPNKQPSSQPSQQPTKQPTKQPSSQPTHQPTQQPSKQPSNQPSNQPTIRPTSSPSKQPTIQPNGKPSVQPTRQPSSQPSRQPTSQPIRRPSNQPTRQPTSQPSHQPSLQPTFCPSRQPLLSPTLQPSRLPSEQPSAEPTYNPSNQPTSEPSNPTAYPTTFRFHFLQNRRAPKKQANAVSANALVEPIAAAAAASASQSPSYVPQLLSQFSFEFYYNYSTKTQFENYPGAAPDSGSQTFDYVGSFIATLYNNVILSDGDAFFRYGNRGRGYIPYISVPGLLTAAQTITVEIWVTFSSAKQDLDATLFAMGYNRIVFLVRDLNITITTYRTYIAVVFDVDTPGNEMRSVFVNGTETSKTPLPALAINLLNGNARHNEMTYIGAPASGRFYAKSLEGRISEFRIWDGKFSKDEVFADYLAGPIGAGITYHIHKDASYNHVNVSFLSTSLQLVDVYMYGGYNNARMFGSETSFSFTPVDPQCQYSPTFSLFDDGTSGLFQQIPAMNFTVALVSTSPAPIFHNSSCDYTHPTAICSCADSLDPMEYMMNTGQTSQTLMVTYVTYSLQTLIFTYKTGVCFEVKGSELFSTSELLYASPSKNISCIKKGSKSIVKGTELPLVFYAFERYPQTTGWQSKQPLKTPNYVVDFGVANAQFFVLDLVSGRSSLVSFVYDNSTTTPPPPQRAPIPSGSNYTIEAQGPNPFFPFDHAFQVFLERDDGNGLFSSAYYIWYIPVTGVIANKVPNFYPVPTDSKLIFLVLRDPPGGTSSATIKAGTTITMGMQVGNVHTSDTSKYSEISADSGGHDEIDSVAAPLGVGVANMLLKTDSVTKYAYAQPYTVQATRASTTHYEYKFTFDYDFSTSKEPNLAGHPSDVIIGGGVDLIVNEARGVALLPNPPPSLKKLDCYYGYDTYQWQPAQITTFMLSVYEIEQLISQLSSVYTSMLTSSNPDSKSSNGVNAPKLLSQINNWNQVLTDYRKHNEDRTSIFTADVQQFQKMVTAFKRFENGGGISLDEVKDDFKASFKGVLDSIDGWNIMGAYLSNQYVPSDPVSYSLDRLKDTGSLEIGVKAAYAWRNKLDADTLAEIPPGTVTEVVPPETVTKVIPLEKPKLRQNAINPKKAAAKQQSSAVKAETTSASKSAGKGGKLKGAIKDAAIGLALGALAAAYEGGMAYAGRNGAYDEFGENFENYYDAAFYKLYSYCGGVKGINGVQVIQNEHVQTVCSDFDSKSWANFRTALTGGCNIPSDPNNPDSAIQNTVLFKSLCSKSNSVVNGKNVPGGVASPMATAGSLLSFLTDTSRGSQKLITFGANAPVTLSWTSNIQDSMEFNNELDGTLANEMIATSSDDFSIGGFIVPGPLSSGSVSDNIQKTGIKISQRSENEHEVMRTIIIDFGDEDMGDLFAVRITEDSAFGTPVFTTMGGSSRCPGESSTSKRDSGVSIVSIQPRCGPDRISPCGVSNLNYGDVATFGIRIQNLSPTRDSVYYTLRLKETYDIAYKTTQYQNPAGEKEGYIRDGTNGDCGTPGLKAGLQVKFQSTELVIPYGITIEVPMGVSMNPNVGSINLCRDFEDIEIMLISTCEIPNPHSQVYQYEEAVSFTAGAKILYNMTTGAQNSTAKFSVHWPALPPFTQNTYYRRTLSEGARGEGTEIFKGMVEMLGEKLSQVDSLEERLNRVDSLEKQLNSLGSLLFICVSILLSVVVVLAVLVVLATFRTTTGKDDEKKRGGPPAATTIEP